MLFPSSNIFVDGGGHNCHRLQKYLHKLPAFDKGFVFEPNPIFHHSYKDSNLILIKKAIWTVDCNLPFYISKDDFQVGSSLIKNKLCRVNSKFKPFFYESSIEVECVDFSNWIKNNTSKKDNLYVKLDIEGAEYDVLWKMIKDGSIHRVKKLFVEFHADHMKIDKASHDLLIKELEKNGITPNDWD